MFLKQNSTLQVIRSPWQLHNEGRPERMPEVCRWQDWSRIVHGARLTRLTNKPTRKKLTWTVTYISGWKTPGWESVAFPIASRSQIPERLPVSLAASKMTAAPRAWLEGRTPQKESLLSWRHWHRTDKVPSGRTPPWRWKWPSSGNSHRRRSRIGRSRRSGGCCRSVRGRRILRCSSCRTSISCLKNSDSCSSKKPWLFFHKLVSIADKLRTHSESKIRAPVNNKKENIVVTKQDTSSLDIVPNGKQDIGSKRKGIHAMQNIFGRNLFSMWPKCPLSRQNADARFWGDLNFTLRFYLVDANNLLGPPRKIVISQRKVSFLCLFMAKVLFGPIWALINGPHWCTNCDLFDVCQMHVRGHRMIWTITKSAGTSESRVFSQIKQRKNLQTSFSFVAKESSQVYPVS